MALHNFSSPFLPSFPGLFGSPGLYAPVGPSVAPYIQQNLQPPRPPEPPRQNRQTFATTARPPPSPFQQPPRTDPSKGAGGYGGYPSQNTRYTRVNSGAPGSGKTSVHAVIDYDDDFDDNDEYYDEPDLEALPPSLRHNPAPTVTPIQGPILIKNGSVPVVPLYSYPTINNGSLVQIPKPLVRKSTDSSQPPCKQSSQSAAPPFYQLLLKRLPRDPSSIDSVARVLFPSAFLVFVFLFFLAYYIFDSPSRLE